MGLLLKILWKIGPLLCIAVYCFIAVVSEAAREAILEELRLGPVLTIYEAKGLEFDDVLLNNFCKDSQVCHVVIA